ncbi:hypothetical protein GF382_03665 [Candidatus Falkowbacteria bacterium]|nr:hypothetical protein [Candidatus Falkowbacteria bacterium]
MMMFYIFLAASLCVGLIMGSFLNCFIWRLYKNEGMWDRSYCPKCRKKISWYDNIPVLSFVFLRGKCRNCRKPISWQYPIVEAILGVLFMLAFYLNWIGSFGTDVVLLSGDLPFMISLARDWFVIFTSMSILVYDWRWMIIPDRIIIPAICLVLALNIFLGYSLAEVLYPALLGGGFFLLQFLISRGRWVGGGDARFGVFMGAVLADIWHLVIALLLAYWIGSIIGIFLIISKKKTLKSQLPFGIFLSVGLIISLFFANDILQWYLGLL